MAEDEGARGPRLRSYEPPEIEIVVPQAGEMDVLAAAEAYLSSSGAHLPDLTDEWVRSHAGTLHVPEGTGARGWLAKLKEQLVQAQHDQALAEKPARCAQALAERLIDPPDDMTVEHVRLGLLQSLAAERTHDPKGFEERLRLQKVASVEELAAQLAPQVAAQASALDAWGAHENIEVTEAELPRCLRMAPTQAKTRIQQARHDGGYPVLLRDARRNKCALLLAERCQCHLVPESEASAKARWQSYETYPAFAHIDLEHERQRLFPET